jgi:hypothetical protein
MNPRIKLILLFSIFAAPFVLAYTAYHFWTPKSFVNRGTLLQPVQLLADEPVQVDALAATSWSKQDKLNGKWILLLPENLPCAAACEERLVGLRQVHVAMGKHQPRIQRAVFVLSGTPDPTYLARLPDVVWLQGDKVRAKLQAASDAGTTPTQHIYLIDPLGNLFMRYPVNADLKDLVKDLERLLKASRIG